MGLFSANKIPELSPEAEAIKGEMIEMMLGKGGKDKEVVVNMSPATKRRAIQKVVALLGEDKNAVNRMQIVELGIETMRQNKRATLEVATRVALRGTRALFEPEQKVQDWNDDQVHRFAQKVRTVIDEIINLNNVVQQQLIIQHLLQTNYKDHKKVHQIMVEGLTIFLSLSEGRDLVAKALHS